MAQFEIINIASWYVSDLDKRPIDKFSHDKAHICASVTVVLSYEPSHEKTCLWGFQPSPKQIRLYC